MKTNFLEEQYKFTSLFLDESIFDSNYIPDKLLHRENELILLSRIFLPLIKKPNTLSKKVLVMGNIGVGKTITLHNFGEMLKESAIKRKLNLKFFHLNCRSLRTDYLVLKNILDPLIGKIPLRGLSPGELFNILIKYLKEKKCHLVVVLDELDFLLKKKSDLIYSLTRLNENSFSNDVCLSLIGVIKNITDLNNLDPAALSSLQSEIIKFEKYSGDQIFDILNERVKAGLKPGVASDKILRMISNFSSKSGDMRRALKMIKNTVGYSMSNKLKSLTPEAVRYANSNYDYSPLSDGVLNYLNIHETILLKAICNLLISQKCQKIPLSEVKEEYFNCCNHYNKPHRSNTQIWEYIQNLKKYDHISTIIKNKNIRGRQTFIGISNYSAKKVRDQLELILKNNG